MSDEKLPFLTTMRNCVAPLLICFLQTSNSHEHPLLDRAASQWTSAVAGQGTHTDGLSQHPLLQCVLGAAQDFQNKTIFPLSVGQLKLLSVIKKKRK